MNIDPKDIPDFGTIDDRWSWVLDMLPAIGKDSRNEQQNFNYRSIDTVLDRVNPLFAIAGVHVIPTRQVFERGEYTTGRGTLMHTCMVTSDWQIRDVQGAVIEAQTVGEGSDAGDKATSKAQTMAFKYLLWPALAIRGNEDPDGQVVEEAAAPVQQIREQVQSRGSGGDVRSSQGQPPAQNRPQGGGQRQNGNGGNRQGGGKGETWMISPGQKSALFAASGAQKNWKINDACQIRFGKNEDDLTWGEAKALLTEVNADDFDPNVFNTPTAGIEQVQEAFGGAEIVNNPEEIPGYNGEPF